MTVDERLEYMMESRGKEYSDKFRKIASDYNKSVQVALQTDVNTVSAILSMSNSSELQYAKELFEIMMDWYENAKRDNVWSDTEVDRITDKLYEIGKRIIKYQKRLGMGSSRKPTLKLITVDFDKKSTDDDK